MTINFKAKLGSVAHHGLKADGNTTYEVPYVKSTANELYKNGEVLIQSYDTNVFGDSICEGYPFINIAQSANQKRMKVKFYISNNLPVRYYLWTFGDGTTEKTINSEVLHVYDLLKKDEWLTNTGLLPVRTLRHLTGRWANVKVDLVGLSGNTTSCQNDGFIYEVTGEGYTLYNVVDSTDPEILSWNDTYETAPEYQDNY